jgi:hypothetical protein
VASVLALRGSSVLCHLAMPPLDTLSVPNLSLSKRIWMSVLHAYLVLVAVNVVQDAAGQ